MKKTAVCECGGELKRRQHEHVQDVAGVKVTDSRGLVRVCDTCGEAMLTMEELSRYERAAAAIVFRDAPARVTGGVVKFARKALGMTQAELGAAIDCRGETVSRWEHGHDAIPRAPQLAIVALLEARPEPQLHVIPARKVRTA